jgi:hypothetical protein
VGVCQIRRVPACRAGEPAGPLADSESTRTDRSGQSERAAQASLAACRCLHACRDNPCISITDGSHGLLLASSAAPGSESLRLQTVSRVRLVFGLKDRLLRKPEGNEVPQSMPKAPSQRPVQGQGPLKGLFKDKGLPLSQAKGTDSFSPCVAQWAWISGRTIICEGSICIRKLPNHATPSPWAA